VRFQNNPELNFIPQGLDHFFPNFFALRIFDANINTLNGDEFSNYQQLTWLAIEDSNLMKVASELFVNNLNLDYVSFWNNQLTSIGWNLLDNLNATGFYRFSQNECVNRNANNNALQFNQLIMDIRANCSDFTNQVTTTAVDELTTVTNNNIITTTDNLETTSGDDQCSTDDIDARVCQLESEMKQVKLENLELRNNIDTLNQQIANIMIILQEVLTAPCRCT
jgi:hypothetical protein